MITIPINQGKLLLIDDEDYNRVVGYRYAWTWKPTSSPSRKAGCVEARVSGSRNDGRRIKLHRFILGLKTSAQIDHADLNPLNNCKSNLRIATGSQNAANRSLRSDSTSGFKGVSWDKTAGKWRAYLTKNKKRFHAGFFDEKSDAASAYDTMAKKHFGEFALTNKKLGLL